MFKNSKTVQISLLSVVLSTFVLPISLKQVKSSEKNEVTDYQKLQKITSQEEFIRAITTNSPNEEGYIIEDSIVLDEGVYETPIGKERTIYVSSNGNIKLRGKVFLNGNNSLDIVGETDSNNQRHIGGSLIQIDSDKDINLKNLKIYQPTVSSITGSSSISTTSNTSKDTNITIQNCEIIGSEKLKNSDVYSLAFDINGNIGDVVLENNIVSNMFLPSYVSSENSSKIFIKSNKFKDSYFGLSLNESKNQSKVDYQIISNRFENIGNQKDSSAIELNGGESLVRISGNVFLNSATEDFLWIKDLRKPGSKGFLDINSNIIQDGILISSYDVNSNNTKIYLNNIFREGSLSQDSYIKSLIDIFQSEDGKLEFKIKKLNISENMDILKSKLILIENGVAIDSIIIDEIYEGLELVLKNFQLKDDKTYRIKLEVTGETNGEKNLFVSESKEFKNLNNDSSEDEDFILNSLKPQETSVEFEILIKDDKKYEFPLLLQIVEDYSGRKIETIIGRANISNGKIVKNINLLEEDTSYSYVVKEAYKNKTILQGDFKTKKSSNEGEDKNDYFITSHEIKNSIIDEDKVILKPHLSVLDRLEGSKDFSSNIKDIKVVFENKAIKITGLIPNKIYDDLLIDFTDKFGKKRSIKISEFKTAETNSDLKNFIKNSYVNALGREPEEQGYYFWFDKLSNNSVTPEFFVKNLLNENEFNEMRETSIEKIEGLYSVIVNRVADKTGLEFWTREYELYLKNGDNINSSLNKIVDRMVNEEEFKELTNSFYID